MDQKNYGLTYRRKPRFRSYTSHIWALSNSYDVILLLGLLYHLHADRS